MDMSSYNSVCLKSLSYNDLRKFCRENNVTCSSRKKVDLLEAAQDFTSNTVSTANDSSVSERGERSSSASSASSLYDDKRNSRRRKRNVLSDISNATNGTIVIGSTISSRPSKIQCKRNICDDEITLGSSLYSEFENSCSISSTPVPSKNENQGKTLARLSHNVLSREEKFRNMINTFEASAKPLLDEIETQRANLEKQKSEASNYLNKVLEHELEKKETELRSKFDEESKSTEDRHKENVNVLNIALEEKGGKLLELTDMLEEKNVLIDGYKRMEAEHAHLKVIIEEQKKEMEMKDEELKKQVEMTKTFELINAGQSAIDEMEDEFTCIICQELFINAITLPCGHSFCEICLRTWFKTKKSCPVCRRNVKMKAISSVILDSAVEKIMERMNEESKRKQVQLKRERNEQKRREDAAPDHHGIRAMFYRVVDDDHVLPAQGNRNNTDANRRRSRSQSPARNLQPRVNQGAAQVARATASTSASNNQNNNNQNNNSNNQNNRNVHVVGNNQWRNGGGFHSNYGNNYGRPLGVRCFRCGVYGHVASMCPRR